jgi:eukaryotic-like serine/threonine-protein kinase
MSSPQPLGLDTMVAQYRILEKIGEGGLGVVYRAHDERLGRDVALKFLPPQLLADDSARKLLLREARTASALNHPNICTVHDVGEIEGRNYFVMEFVKGRPLSEQIQAEGLSAETVTRYGEQICDALEHAHQHGVIHRDLKTSNIMITPEGRVKVLDFGLAKRQTVDPVGDQTRSASRDGPGIGTVHYLAPEVFRGDPADARTDIWALGVVLYEMAGGRRPFTGKTAYELSSAILRSEPPPLPAHATPGLRAVIERCLAKQPRERYQHASEVGAALHALRSQTPWTVPTPSPAGSPTAGVDDLAVTGSARLPASSGGAAPQERPHLLRFTAVLAALVLVAAGAFIARKWQPTGSGAIPIHSLAVLPLENLSGDAAEEYFADGMTEELTTQLAQISALRVISRTSVMRYKNSKKSLPEVAKDLRVDAVVEGSVLRSGDKVRITAQLIQAPTDKHLWAKSYEGDARDVLALQQQVAQAIAEEIKVQLTPQEQSRLSKPHAVSPAAYEAYLKGNYLNRGSGAQQRKAKEYFEQAIQIDPSYAPAYAGLADYYWSSLDLRPRDSMPIAKQNALKALELDSSLAQAHYELAAVHFYGDWDWEGAEKEFKTALELNPGEAESHRFYSFFLVARSRAPEALAEIRRAQDLDPLSISTQVTAGFVLYFARDFDKAIEQCRRVLELDPNSAGAYDCLGSSYLAQGRFEQAITASQKASSLSSDDAPRLVGLGRAYARADRKGDASRVLDQLRQLSQHGYVPPYFFATIYGALGERDQAFEKLTTAVDERDGYLPWLNVDSAADSLRNDPRFQQVLRRVGLAN